MRRLRDPESQARYLAERKRALGLPEGPIEAARRVADRRTPSKRALLERIEEVRRRVDEPPTLPCTPRPPRDPSP